MSKFNLCGLMLLAVLSLSAVANDKIVEGIIVDSSDGADTQATIVRDGEQIDAVEGMPVYAGDEIKTTANGMISVGFLDQTALTLYGSTEISVGGSAAIGTSEGATFNLGGGHLFVSTKSTESMPLNLTVGDRSAPVVRAAGPKPLKMELILTKNSSGAFVTNVEVTSGSVTLTPATGGSPVVATVGGATVMTISTATNPPSGTVTTTATTKTDIKTLKIGTLSDIQVSQGKTGFSFKTAITEGDGSVTKGAISTDLTGKIIKDSSKTSNKTDKSSLSWSESVSTGKIAFKAAFGGNSFSAAFTGGVTSKATLKGSDKTSYVGSATYNSTTGLITFTGTSKAGTTATFTYDPTNSAQAVETVKLGSATPVSKTYAYPVTPDNTPDLRTISITQEPKSH
ncbi:MAG TPA: hypothetical protein VKX17_08535 [Planctomycetota bacterium]|nr:hypothetical protein [Planctomycetota bacterium]